MSKNEILIYDVIGVWGIQPTDISKQLSNFDDTSEITVRINSPGGEVFDGFAIYNLLKESPAVINVVIDGLAASIASVIAMAGDTISISKSAMIMVHNPSTSILGDAKRLHSLAKNLEKIQQNIVQIYNDRTTLSTNEIAKLMENETWFTASEALNFGLVDTINEDNVKNISSSATVDILNKYSNVPKCVGDMCKMTEDTEKYEAQGDQLGNFSGKTVVEPDEVDLDQLEDWYPELINQVRQNAIVGEQGRIKAVEESVLPGHEKMIDNMRFDGVTTGAQAAIAVVKAERAIAAERGMARAQDSVAVPPSNSNIQKTETLEQKEDREWATKAGLRELYCDEIETYRAYNRAVSDGQVNIIGKS